MNIQSGPLPVAKDLRWLVLDLNSFFASCEQQADPSLRGQPLAIVPMIADTTCAIAASYEAKACGIKTGTLVREAKRLCPDLKLIVSNPKLYVDFHHRILHAIEACAPIEDVMSIDEVACSLDLTQRDPAIARALARQMKERLRAEVGECLTCSIGIAANKLLAKLASDMQKPDGLVILNPHEMPAPILHLAPDAICGIGPRMAARLEQAGITDMQSLWNLDSAEMKRVWGGITGVRFHALLHGADLPSPARPRRSMSHQHVLPPTERTMQAALPVVRHLLTRLCVRLRRETFYARRLVLDIKWMHDYGYHIDEARFTETQDTAALLRTLMTLWRKAPASGKPLRLGVTLAELVEEGAHQMDLFEKKRPAALTQAIDTLNQKFGRDTLTYGTATTPIPSKIPFSRVPEREEV